MEDVSWVTANGKTGRAVASSMVIPRIVADHQSFNQFEQECTFKLAIEKYLKLIVID